MHLLLALLLAVPTRELALADCSAQIVAADGEKLWPGWSHASRSLLLVTEEAEYFVAAPSAEMVVRPRKFDPKLLATFPALSSEPTVVVGTPAATGKTETAWLLTLVHEHFHQFQYSQPGYYERTEKLGLSHGDQTGMWMLDYAFPYTDRAVVDAYSAFSRAVAAALRARNTPAFAEQLREAKHAWRTFRLALKPDDYAYFRFQVWQEGVARYTEVTLSASPSCAAATAPAQLAARNALLASLDKPNLLTEKRVAFYALGAAIAMLLDETSPDWKRSYNERPFEIDGYFAP
ncbi:MAG TPA: hypothetical protein VGR02_22795 [Thermoanaerobaculia bacterium]|jgi:hypothetical protein|nr:hypothetical protein [Thermoanaerobaculia bacterium]